MVINAAIETFKTILYFTLLVLARSVHLKRLGWWGNDETPVGEGARRDPTGSETTEEAPGKRRID